jgi:hypothetical protein
VFTTFVRLRLRFFSNLLGKRIEKNPGAKALKNPLRNNLWTFWVLRGLVGAPPLAHTNALACREGLRCIIKDLI